MNKDSLNKQITSLELDLEPADKERLATLCGPFDENIKLIERRLGLEIIYHNHHVKILGNQSQVPRAAALLKTLYLETQSIKGQQPSLSAEQVHLAIQELIPQGNNSDNPDDYTQKTEAVHSEIDKMHQQALTIKTKRGIIKPRGENQSKYISNVLTHDITFGIGPAGTGKTYLAVAAAVNAFERQEIRRILLTRPAVEAGEKLGFLPGDLSQKVDPYLRPLYDALFEMLGFEKVEKLIERKVIEVAPLAYMRGRTLNDAFIILDESQNTTLEQMKMFLTRIGFNSRAVITGDITQIDLPRHQQSGLRHAIEVLSKVDAVSFNFFQAKDVVRHPVVAQIVEAYEAHSEQADKTQLKNKTQEAN